MKLAEAQEKITLLNGKDLYEKVEKAVTENKITRKQATQMYKVWLDFHNRQYTVSRSVPCITKQKYVSERQYDQKYSYGGYKFVEKTPDGKVLIEYRVVEPEYESNHQPIDIEKALEII